MNLAIILAGGKGERLLSSQIPKQFIEIDNKPVIIHTIEKFLLNSDIDYIVIPTNVKWIEFMQNSINKYLKSNKVFVCDGGISRNDSIKKGLIFANKKFKLNKNDIILTHDGVRVLVSSKIIADNLQACKSWDCVDTIVHSTDTIVCSKDQKEIIDIPNRDFLFLGQSPQTFKYHVLNNIYFESNFDTLLFNSTDVCKLAHEKQYKIHIIFGDYNNFKLTNDFDLAMLKVILESEKRND